MQREILKRRTWQSQVIRDVPRKGGKAVDARNDMLDIITTPACPAVDAKNKLYGLHSSKVDV